MRRLFPKKIRWVSLILVLLLCEQVRGVCEIKNEGDRIQCFKFTLSSRSNVTPCLARASNPSNSCQPGACIGGVKNKKITVCLIERTSKRRRSFHCKPTQPCRSEECIMENGHCVGDFVCAIYNTISNDGIRICDYNVAEWNSSKLTTTTTSSPQTTTITTQSSKTSTTTISTTSTVANISTTTLISTTTEAAETASTNAMSSTIKTNETRTDTTTLANLLTTETTSTALTNDTGPAMNGSNTTKSNMSTIKILGVLGGVLILLLIVVVVVVVLRRMKIRRGDETIVLSLGESSRRDMSVTGTMSSSRRVPIGEPGVKVEGSLSSGNDQKQQFRTKGIVRFGRRFSKTKTTKPMSTERKLETEETSEVGQRQTSDPLDESTVSTMTDRQKTAERKRPLKKGVDKYTLSNDDTMKTTASTLEKIKQPRKGQKKKSRWSKNSVVRPKSQPDRITLVPTLENRSKTTPLSARPPSQAKSAYA